MDFRFTAEEEAFRKEVHDFIEAECPDELRKGGVNLFEQAGSFLTWRKRVADKGWVAPAWPKEYGGAGMTIMQQFICSLASGPSSRGRRCGAGASPTLRPAPPSPLPIREPSATATTTSSTARRSGPLSPTCPSTCSSSPARTRKP